jgi:hypothetical protein
LLKKLKHLSIAGCFSVTANGLKAFLAAGKILQLESLDISRLKVKGQVLSVLNTVRNPVFTTFSCLALE